MPTFPLGIFHGRSTVDVALAVWTVAAAAAADRREPKFDGAGL